MPSHAQHTPPFVSVNPDEFITFCDGLEAAGMVEYAQRGRAVARELAAARQDLASTVAALDAMRADRDRWRDDRWRETHGQAFP